MTLQALEIQGKDRTGAVRMHGVGSLFSLLGLALGCVQKYNVESMGQVYPTYRNSYRRIVLFFKKSFVYLFYVLE